MTPRPTYTGGKKCEIIFSKYFLLYFDFRLNHSEWNILNVLITNYFDRYDIIFYFRRAYVLVNLLSIQTCIGPTVQII